MTTHTRQAGAHTGHLYPEVFEAAVSEVLAQGGAPGLHLPPVAVVALPQRLLGLTHIPASSCYNITRW